MEKKTNKHKSDKKTYKNGEEKDGSDEESWLKSLPHFCKQLKKNTKEFESGEEQNNKIAKITKGSLRHGRE